MSKPRKIVVRKTPSGLHLYTARIKWCGWYGWGNTPTEARIKLLEILKREKIEQ